jgi:hypothetical protein
VIGRDRPAAETVLADMLVAASDNIAHPMRRRTAEHLAAHTLELARLAGYELTRLDDAWRSPATETPIHHNQASKEQHNARHPRSTHPPHRRA